MRYHLLTVFPSSTLAGLFNASTHATLRTHQESISTFNEKGNADGFTDVYLGGYDKCCKFYPIQEIYLDWLETPKSETWATFYVPRQNVLNMLGYGSNGGGDRFIADAQHFRQKCMNVGVAGSVLRMQCMTAGKEHGLCCGTYAMEGYLNRFSFLQERPITVSGQTGKDIDTTINMMKISFIHERDAVGSIYFLDWVGALVKWGQIKSTSEDFFINLVKNFNDKCLPMEKRGNCSKQEYPIVPADKIELVGQESAGGEDGLKLLVQREADIAQALEDRDDSVVGQVQQAIGSVVDKVSAVKDAVVNATAPKQ